MITEATAHELEPDLSAYLTGHVASAPKRPDLVNGLSYDAGLSQPEEHTSSSAWLDERSFEHTIAVPALSLQPTNLAVDLGCDYTNFERLPNLQRSLVKTQTHFRVRVNVELRKQLLTRRSDTNLS
jgi:hypothetical protein